VEVLHRLLPLAAEAQWLKHCLLMSVRIGLGSEEAMKLWSIQLLLKAAMGILGNLNIHESERDHKVQSIFM